MYSRIIKESVTEIRNSLPSGVMLVAAAKTRSPKEVQAAIKSGINIVGYNYVQEADISLTFFQIVRKIENMFDAERNPSMSQIAKIWKIEYIPLVQRDIVNYDGSNDI